MLFGAASPLVRFPESERTVIREGQTSKTLSVFREEAQSSENWESWKMLQVPARKLGCCADKRSSHLCMDIDALSS